MSTDSPNLHEEIKRILNFLTYREREIIKLRYGLPDGYTYTLQEVGRIFKVTPERIRQIAAKAVKKMQDPTHSRQMQELFEFMARLPMEEHVRQDLLKRAAEFRATAESLPQDPSPSTE